MGEKEQYLKINYPKRVSGLFSITEFKDNGHFIAYLPALQLSGYGDSEKAASDMLVNVVLPDFFRALMELPEVKVHDELIRLGWKRSAFFRKKFHASAFVDKDGLLRDFNLSPETEIKETLIEV